MRNGADRLAHRQDDLGLRQRFLGPLMKVREVKGHRCLIGEGLQQSPLYPSNTRPVTSPTASTPTVSSSTRSGRHVPRVAQSA